jgi:hypothetical protein
MNSLLLKFVSFRLMSTFLSVIFKTKKSDLMRDFESHSPQRLGFVQKGMSSS